MQQKHYDEAYDEAAVRQRLDAERARLQSDIYERTQGSEAVTPVDPISDAGGLESYEADDADAMSDTERNQAVTRNAEQILSQVNAALERLEAGTYDICETCGKPINPRRLEALPYVTLCVDCQAAADQGGPAGRR
jgi:RNA polymerase-binding transcription factor DksA